MSIINNEYEHVFVHIPKCAGWSMESQFFVGGTGHEPLQILSKKENFNENYFKWTFIRDPFTRIASGYYSIYEGGGGTQLQKQTVMKHKTYKDFLLNLKDYLPQRIDENVLLNGDTECLYHFLPLWYYIKSNNTSIDFIGRFENLKDDWEFVCNKLNVSYKLPHINNSNSKPKNYYSIYDDEMTEIILELYNEEIKEYYNDNK